MPKSHTSNPKKRPSSSIHRNWLLIGATVLIIIILTAAMLLMRPEQSATTTSAEISVEQAYKKYQAGTFILDVRQPEEWAEYHIPNTTLIPLDQLEARLNELPTDREIIVVCRSGNRSQSGRDILRKAGFTQSTSMAGGVKQWQASGYPTVTGP